MAGDGESPSDSPPIAPLPLMLVFAGRVAQQQIEEGLLPYQLTMRHVGALGHLARRPDLSHSDLARRAGITAQSMHATVRQLEELGAVTGGNAGQGRRSRLEVTPRGRELLAAANAVIEAVEIRLFDGISPSRRDDARRVIASALAPRSPKP